MIRDPNTVIAAIRLLSLTYPGQRVGQMIVNSIPPGQDLFYIEDRDLAKMFFDYQKRNES